jgi:hypothetical protein
VKLNSKVEAEAVLGSAGYHTFIPQELEEDLGITVVVQEECRAVSWVARCVSLPIVVGSICVDLELYVGVRSSVVVRNVQALVPPCKSLDFS